MKKSGPNSSTRIKTILSYLISDSLFIFKASISDNSIADFLSIFFSILKLEKTFVLEKKLEIAFSAISSLSFTSF